MADHWGRRRTIQFAALWALIAGAIQAGSVNISMFIVGRIVGGFAVGILSTRTAYSLPGGSSHYPASDMVIPIYNSEISPPQWVIVPHLI